MNKAKRSPDFRADRILNFLAIGLIVDSQVYAELKKRAIWEIRDAEQMAQRRGYQRGRRSALR